MVWIVRGICGLSWMQMALQKGAKATQAYKLIRFANTGYLGILCLFD